MGSGHFMGAALLLQSLQLLLVLCLSQFKGKLLDFHLSLEQVYWVFQSRVINTMNGDAMLLHVHGSLQNLFIQSIDGGVDLLFQLGQFVLVFVLK